ncbi:FAD-dependent monooxygenase [Streptomyces europaeiscabiei]|uniref:FAD-dependent monooxygenase n=1 Tax=Streptomyces europaeiscabiei TaxID=146819 RepID=UPI0038D3E2D2
MRVARTTVGIIGGGPAGLLLARLPHRATVAAWSRRAGDRVYLEQRRAGMPEQATVDAPRECGAAERLEIEGLGAPRHRGAPRSWAAPPRPPGPHRRPYGHDLRQDRDRAGPRRPPTRRPATAVVPDGGTRRRGPLGGRPGTRRRGPLGGRPVVPFVHDGNQEGPSRESVVGCGGPARLPRHLPPRVPRLDRPRRPAGYTRTGTRTPGWVSRPKSRRPARS